ncbi:MAG: hypothetical protein CL902_00690 [Dehalococcoidia bacterium]|nr:hypothetical protein [Dehalococcoidia bacterium]|tara:strand:+ start:256 stop:561 length:306 start_codon:yes stop_codon:yes gene_type:complete
MASADVNKNEKSPEVAVSEKQQEERNIEIAQTIGKQYGDSFKKSFDATLINHKQMSAFLGGDPVDMDVPYYKQKISDDLELWCGALKVKEVKKETIECMPS